MTSLEALATGYLFGMLARELGHTPDGFLREVLPQLDSGGNYLPFLRVRMGRGVVRIDVKEELAEVETAEEVTP